MNPSAALPAIEALEMPVVCNRLALAISQRCLHRWLVLKALRSFTKGRLQMDLPGGEQLFFGDLSLPEPTAHIQVRNPLPFFIHVARYGGVGLGEAYTDGWWDTPDLRAVLDWFIINIQSSPQLRGSSQRFKMIGFLKFVNRVQHLLRPNSVKTSRRNISEHYDLGNAFYKLWLDPTMTYSAAKFTRPDQSLEEAQIAKYDALCEKLHLKPGDHVLEIGCGWGGFSMHAASKYGCRVTGVTISHEQFAEATKRVKEAGLDHLIEIRFQDYRHITGQYDKIASIEMLEAVGEKYLETYFAKCAEVLAPHGILAVQMITVPDHHFRQLAKGTDWIQKHIFPGSLLLAVGRVNEAIRKTSKLSPLALEDLGQGYARTMREWFDVFNTKLDEVRAQGFSETFIRKWNYYLKYCESAFATRNISVVQASWSNYHHEAVRGMRAS
ncbi:MAG: class I SAM-dependent methyltransferase [Prosthecobacter sp.]